MAPDGSPARLEVLATRPRGRAAPFPGRPGARGRRRATRHPACRVGRSRARSSRGRSSSTGRCAPTCPTCSRPATASSLTTDCSTSLPAARARPRTSRAGSRARTRSAAPASSPAASARRSSKCSTLSRHAPAYATTRPCAAGFEPVTVGAAADDHKAYYPGSHPITMRYTGDRRTGRLARCPTRRPSRQRDRQTNRHRRDGDLQRDDDRRPVRSRPVIHAAAWLTVGRAAGRSPVMGPRRAALGAQRRVGAEELIALAPRPSTAASRWVG